MHNLRCTILSLFLLVSLSSFLIGQEKNISKSSIQANRDELAQLDEQILTHQRTKNQRKLAKAYEKKADFLYKKTPGVSLIYYENALELYTLVSDNESELRILQLLSKEYTDVSDRQNGLKKMYALLSIYEDQNDSLAIAQTFSGIGSIYADMGDHENALEFMSKALNFCIRLNLKIGEAAIRNNIASVYEHLGDQDAAFKNLRMAERLNKESGNDFWLSINYTTFSNFFSGLDMMDSARIYLFKANEYTFTKGNLIDSVASFQKNGIYYLNVDSIDQALNCFNQGILASRKLGSLKSEANLTHWISELYERNGQMDLALNFLQQRHDLLDSLDKMERGKRLEEYKVLYEVKTLETDLSQSQMNELLATNDATKSRHRFYWLLSILILILFGSIIIIYQYRKQVRSNQHLLEISVKNTTEESNAKDKYAQSKLSDQKKEEILRQLVELMISEQIFTDQDIKLNTVAEKLDVSRTYLSQVINETHDQNFTAYINSHRINLAKTYLLSEEFNKYSIQGIAEIVGFKSVSAFNTSFKKFTGLAPSYYRRNGKKLK